MANKKFYVVWVGAQTGVFDNWEDTQLAVKGYPNARFKAFNSPEEAVIAYRRGVEADDRQDVGNLLRRASSQSTIHNPQSPPQHFPEIDPNAWAVDASCMGNPGIMEYQGVEVATGRVIFRVGPFKKATNNIGEYLAIVHALALMEQRGERHIIYSDSKIAQGWVRKGLCNTKITPSAENQPVRNLIMRADHWLATHSFRVPIIKWDTKRWGEIPADFGRK